MMNTVIEHFMDQDYTKGEAQEFILQIRRELEDCDYDPEQCEEILRDYDLELEQVLDII